MKIFYLTTLFFWFFFAPTVIWHKEKVTAVTDPLRFDSQVDAVKAIIKDGGKYNTNIAFFIDMKIKSGRNRFFIYDLVKEEILDQGLVANGIGSETEVRGNLQFSNVVNSKCTSLGRYSIGKSYRGMFGKAYKLHGLDQTNNNALKRAIVLHHFWAVPYEEQDRYITNSHGCPMVNEVFFQRIEKIIDNSKSDIILNIYY